MLEHGQQQLFIVLTPSKKTCWVAISVFCRVQLELYHQIRESNMIPRKQKSAVCHMLYILNTSQNSLISSDSTKNCLDVASFLGRPDRLIGVFVSKQENHIQCLCCNREKRNINILSLFFMEFHPHIIVWPWKVKPGCFLKEDEQLFLHSRDKTQYSRGYWTTYESFFL